ncbi:3-hydroxyacyl-CoA dehydrogenase [Wenjunlia vitaminophila]|uniref:3-hydroxyacyl-CoA dehydrogenase n=1 Tax=Wenjunlia vitaminophila TaxID=76728 RepID=A0A0T6LMP8_WENVI|nr:3-hydroxyacyl-CoA dehydrogenase [Wenjunlia vitaminophila]KRV47370.1 3-hydroxyacyl-CoA dehydrogenase [Wenjunlia vitaminophila]
MDGLTPEHPVGVVGTGTMGRGIAQVALVAGHRVLLHDAEPGRAAEAVTAIVERLDRQVAKGRMSEAQRAGATARLAVADDLSHLADAALVVEAVVEDIAVKRRLFADLEAVVGDDCLLATNTSSLPVTAVGAALKLPGRLLGLHFFNPAPVLPLVEVVSGAATDPAVAERARATVLAWGKTPVACADTPGFLVNRLARPYYAEAFALFEERAADPATIDAVLRESGGFRMGPFELTDLIGHDVNEAVTRSVWTAFHHDPRFVPSLAQRQLVEAGRLGRKSGQGWYGYRDGEPRPEPRTAPPAAAPSEVAAYGDLGPAGELLGLVEEAGIEVRRESVASGVLDPGALVLPDGTELALVGTREHAGFEPVIHFDLALDYRAATRIALAASPTARPEALDAAVGLFQALGKQVSVVEEVAGLVVARTVAMVVNLAVDAVDRGVATPGDVDTAMRLGVNYPLGPLEWAGKLGWTWVSQVLASLHTTYPTGRYAPAPGLRRRWVAERYQGPAAAGSTGPGTEGGTSR